MTVPTSSANRLSNPAGDADTRLIDTWFPCAEVDVAVGTPAGSGLSEKALFTWFASRPIAQARAAVLCSLLPDTAENREDIRAAVRLGDRLALERLRERIGEQYGSKPPVVLDVFSGRGILPLEAARAGATAVGTDLSPVATLAGRLLADYPLRDWATEPPLPYAPTRDLVADDGDTEDVLPERKLRRKKEKKSEGQLGFDGIDERDTEPRLLVDVRNVLAEVGRRVAAQLKQYYPGNPKRGGLQPWAYLWAVTIPCDSCGRRFPLIGSMVLRHPYKHTQDLGQSLALTFEGSTWATRVDSGLPQQNPTFAAPAGKRGKSARCPFHNCGNTHNLDVVKAKGFAGQYVDYMLAVAEIDRTTNQKVFRAPRADEIAAAELRDIEGNAFVPEEPIPATSGIDARQYGYVTYGSLMNRRQALLFSTTANVIDNMYAELRTFVSDDYATALVGYAAANITRQLRRSTRGSRKESRGKPDGLEQNRVYCGDIFTNQSTLSHAFDYLEASPGSGPGTWTSVASSLANALRKVLEESYVGARSVRFRRGSASALPFRDRTVDAIITDPPYYAMVAYADSSDIFYVWLKRALKSAMPDLFARSASGPDGLQDKTLEIIVKGRGAKGHGDHRTEDFYEDMLASSFREARRVLRESGHLTVIFGHSDPEAWKRLLAALTDAGFIVTSSWPSRTETAVTGVATISVTVSIGARVAPPDRPLGIAAQVDAEVVDAVKERCRGWDTDGLALEDQLMASYGAALQLVGRYQRVITPDGAAVPLEHYMTLSRRAVRDAVALRLDELPLETFDPYTRLAVFWHELYGRDDVPKGEARFFAQSDSLRLEDLRGRLLAETKAGYRLRHDEPERLTPRSSTYEVVRGMAAAWNKGTEAVGACLVASDLNPTDVHLWAVVSWLATKLPASDHVAVNLAAATRNRSTIQAAAAAAASQASANVSAQPGLFEEIL